MLENSGYYKEDYDWSKLGTTAHPFGWNGRYYNASTGEAVSGSIKYLRTVDAPIYVDGCIKLEYYLPDEYKGKIYFYDINNNFLGTNGDWEPYINININEINNLSYVKFAISGFNNNGTLYAQDENFISQVKAIFYKSLEEQIKFDEELIAQNYQELEDKINDLQNNDNASYKKSRTGDFEFFTIKNERPLSFGDVEILDDSLSEEIECVLRLPESYSVNGNPTRLILCCHGASGYIESTSSTWYNNTWKNLMDFLLDNGYAVFDCNIFPTSVGTNLMGRALGSPLYINNIKKAYDYILKNYNVLEKIFVHGTSMGGVGASNFVKAYPQLVLAESSFAGRDTSQYIYQYSTNNFASDDDFGKIYGYANIDELTNDKWSHIEGSSFSLSLLKYNSGILIYPPSREDDFSGWLDYYGEIQNHSQNDSIGEYVAYRTVPYKAWDSWGDNVQYTKAKLILQQAFRRSGAIYEVVVDETATHHQLSYGLVNNMKEQLLAWYKRWE